MTQDIVALDGRGTGEYIPLARTQKGTRFRKQILKIGEPFVHPANPLRTITVDQKFAQTLKENFESGICDIVQIPIVNDANLHVEDPLRNAGEVLSLSYDDKGVYVEMDVRKHSEEFGNTILGASALMSLDYEDTKTGKRMGPTLLHVAATNRPYITNLESFEEMVAASGKSAVDTNGESPVVFIPADHKQTEEKMELKDALAFLKDEHGIDVEALQSQSKAPDNSELITALSNVLSGTGVIEKQTKEVTLPDVTSAVIELAETNVALSGKVDTLVARNEAMENAAAEAEVDELVKQGRVLPRQRDVMVTLSRTNREQFEALVPEDSIVSLSAVGVDTYDAPEKSKAMQDDIERLSALANGSK